MSLLVRKYDCGSDMPLSCCVIGNYWDCDVCHGSGYGVKVISQIHDEITFQITTPTMAKIMERDTAGMLEEMTKRMETALWSDDKVEPTVKTWLEREDLYYECK